MCGLFGQIDKIVYDYLITLLLEHLHRWLVVNVDLKKSLSYETRFPTAVSRFIFPEIQDDFDMKGDSRWPKRKFKTISTNFLTEKDPTDFDGVSRRFLRRRIHTLSTEFPHDC